MSRARRRGIFWAGVFATVSAGIVAHAQPRIPPTKPVRPVAPTAPPIATTPTNLRAHVGTDHVSRLLRSADPDERIRGIERASSIGTPEAIALLVDALERGPQLKADTRALLAAARALARFADQERARAGLLTILSVGNPGLAGRLPTTRTSPSGEMIDEGDPIARAELAREVAGIALARSGGDRALEALYGAARGGGSGQTAALIALARHPPREPGFWGSGSNAMPVPVIRLLGQLGDLRALDVLHAAARSNDVAIRCAALLSLAELGDQRAVPLARSAVAESDVRLRAASGEAFILLSAPERFKATAAIVADDATTAIGLKMADRVFNAEITKLVAARAWTHPERELRMSAVRALGRSPDPDAANALVDPRLLGDPELAYFALHALARSPAPNAGAKIAELLKGPLGHVAARAYVVRALVRGERIRDADDVVFALARSKTPTIRALGVFAQVALGEASVESVLDDREPRVRRAAALAAQARPTSASLDRHLLEQLAKENDPVTRQVLAFGLAGGDPEGIVKTSTLIDRAESAGGDAPLAALALARRADEGTERKTSQLLGSRDPVLRAHVARGLAQSALPDAAGRLADLYAWETDAEVRRAVVSALAARVQDEKAPARRQTLELAATLDPDGPVRQAATLALAGVSAPTAPAAIHEVAWLRMTRDGGQTPGEAYVGSVLRSDGVAVPVVFDEDGFALVPGLPPGEARLVLAPRLPTYKEAKEP